MKLSHRSIIPAATLSVTMLAAAHAFGFRDTSPMSAEETNAAVTVITTKILEGSQIAHQRLDDSLAAKFLDHYLDTLDGGHMLFLQSDLDEFAKARPTLAEATRDRGDSALAHTIFARFLERLDQRVAFVTDQLNSGIFDFSSDETFVYDRKNAPHPTDITAAQNLWRQQLRYEYLQEKLAGKKEAEIVKTLSRRSARTAETMRKSDSRAVLEYYLESLAQSYDPHSDYMGAEQLKSFQIGMNLSLIGIGATLRSQDGYCKITDLIPGGPAARSGLLKSGDRIVGVAQQAGAEFTDIVDLPLSQAVDLIRGKKGSSVYLNLIPANSSDDSARKTVTIVREEIKLEDQQAKAKIIDLPTGDRTQRIGVIDLTAFYAGEDDGKSNPASATEDVSKIITKLQREKVTGIILDLRRNGGGSLQEAISLTGLFIPYGPVVQTRDLEGHLEVGKDFDGRVAYDGPLVVLTSRFSASASEIVAGALQDYGRAIVVGDTCTFGKGTVQTIVPLTKVMRDHGLIPGSDPGALKVTISKFYRPSGKSTQLEGVKADIVVPSLTDQPEIGESDLGNPLPWDTIAPVKYTQSNRVSASLATLRVRSDQRITKDPDFAELKTDIEYYRKIRDDKSASLNEVRRKKEKADLAARADALKKARLARGITPPPAYEVTLKNAFLPGLGDPVKQKTPAADLDDDAELGSETAATEDIVLSEAQRILLDYTTLLNGQALENTAQLPLKKLLE